MDETGLDVQVISLTTPLPHDFGPESVDMARWVNDALATAITRHPTRFRGFATLPVAMPEEAASGFERYVRTLGFKETMLCGRVGRARSLDDPGLTPHLLSSGVLPNPLALADDLTPLIVQTMFEDNDAPRRVAMRSLARP